MGGIAHVPVIERAGSRAQCPGIAFPRPATQNPFTAILRCQGDPSRGAPEIVLVPAVRDPLVDPETEGHDGVGNLPYMRRISRNQDLLWPPDLVLVQKCAKVFLTTR